MSNFNDSYFLAQQLKEGNAKAFDFLVQTYYQKLCSYIFTLTKDHASAEDVVQDVFAHLWVKRKYVDPKSSLKNYLFRSAYNKFVDQYRKNKPVIYLEKKHIESIDMAVENDIFEIDLLIEIVNREIDKLPPKCRDVFILNKKEGLTHTEISEHLDISLKTVEGHMSRAFKILSEKIEDKMKPIFLLLFNYKTTT